MSLEILTKRLKDLQDHKVNVEIEYYKLLGRIGEVEFLIGQAEMQDLVDKGEPDANNS